AGLAVDPTGDVPRHMESSPAAFPIMSTKPLVVIRGLTEGGRMKSVVARLLLLGLVPIAACGGSTATTTTGADIILGSAISLTGQQSKEGTLAKQGYDLWLDWINQQGGIT